MWCRGTGQEKERSSVLVMVASRCYSIAEGGGAGRGRTKEQFFSVAQWKYRQNLTIVHWARSIVGGKVVHQITPLWDAWMVDELLICLISSFSKGTHCSQAQLRGNCISLDTCLKNKQLLIYCILEVTSRAQTRRWRRLGQASRTSSPGRGGDLWVNLPCLFFESNIPWPEAFKQMITITCVLDMQQRQLASLTL